MVEGICKLLLSGRVRSAKLFARLVLLWFNPVVEDDVNLRQCIGVFLPAFAFASRFVVLDEYTVFNKELDFGPSPQSYSNILGF